MLAWAAAMGVGLMSLPAAADDCGTSNSNPTVYVTGTAKNYVAALARALYVDTQPLTLVWAG